MCCISKGVEQMPLCGGTILKACPGTRVVLRLKPNQARVLGAGCFCFPLGSVGNIRRSKRTHVSLLRLRWGLWIWFATTGSGCTQEFVHSVFDGALFIRRGSCFVLLFLLGRAPRYDARRVVLLYSARRSVMTCR